MPTLPINWLLKNHLGGAADRGPVQLTVTYVATQFEFKWKAPAGSFLIFDDGDGTSTTTEGQDAVLMTHTTGYSGAGTYKFYITGDVLDLTYIDIASQAFASGDITDWNKILGLTYITVAATGVSGSFTDWGNLTLITLFQAHSTNVTGNIEGLTAWVNCTNLRLNTATINGNAALLSTLTSATLLRLDDTSVTFDTTPAWTNASASIRLDDVGATAQMVDNMIASLKTCIGSTLNIAGNNAARTSASDADKVTLLANGNTLTVNE